MPMIGHTVAIKEVLEGSKLMTIRKLRKNPLKIGQTLKHWAYPRSKKTKFLIASRITELFLLRHSEMLFVEEIAQRDGFQTSVHMYFWFKIKHKIVKSCNELQRDPGDPFFLVICYKPFPKLDLWLEDGSINETETN